MALFGALSLLFVVLFRPQEIWPTLEPLRLLTTCAALTLGGALWERLRTRAPLSRGYFGILVCFLAWATLSAAQNLGFGSGVAQVWATVGLNALSGALFSLALSDMRRVRLAVGLLIVVVSVIAAVCVHQSWQTPECVVLDAKEGERSEGIPDGRPCESPLSCETEDASKTYACEKAGLFGTFTQGRRVRWRGTLGDPNELAVLLAVSLPLLHALAKSARMRAVRPLLGMLVPLFLWVIVLTGSRTGQLVVITVLGTMLVRRVGLKGLMFGLVLALPVILFGGREGEEADASSMERTELLYQGLEMMRASPMFGVGIEQFADHTPLFLTAHNSYVLAFAELGALGGILWLVLVYSCSKVPRTIAKGPYSETLVLFADGLATSYTGLFVGILFLSFCYKALLFVFVGFSGALYACARQENPKFAARPTPREVVGLVFAALALFAALVVLTRMKLG